MNEAIGEQSAIGALIKLAASGHRKYTCHGVEIDGVDLGDWVVEVRNVAHACKTRQNRVR